MSLRPDTIILASSNPNKAREFEALLAGIHVQPLPDSFSLPPETGDTFHVNALLKAESVREQYLELSDAGELGAPPWVMADDSGIEVEALGNAPGIYSARFAGVAASDADNVRKLLEELAGRTDRGARFVCEIACLAPDGRLLTARGELKGAITAEPRGESGFGYDPIFMPEDFGLTVAELGAEEKNRISHRARAALNLLAQLSGGQQ